MFDREGSGCSLTTDDSSNDFSIFAKFFTKRALNIDVIARTFNPLWRYHSGFKIKSLDDHIILFTFDNKDNVDRILLSEPWSFDKHLVVLQQYEKEMPIYDIKFERASFWDQLHGIPLHYMTLEATLKISNVIGEVSRPKKFKGVDRGNFLQLKVSIDLSLPLCRGRLISLKDGKQIWVSFKYERLPNFCYWCGRLIHDDKDCEIWIESKGTLKLEERQFGAGLRASAYVSTKKAELRFQDSTRQRRKLIPVHPILLWSTIPRVFPRRRPVGRISEEENVTKNLERLKQGRNVRIAHTRIKDTLFAVTDDNNCLIKSGSNTQAVSNMHHKEFDLQLKEINSELAKFDNIETSNTNQTKTNSHAIIIFSSPTQLNEAREYDETARAPNLSP